jgi:HAD superfamily hydrolase (TIGR01509 family)
MSVKLVIFDMDGTIFESFLDWPRIRKDLGLENRNILQAIYRSGRVDHRKLSLLEKYERENTLKAKPVRGIKSFLAFLDTRQVKPVLVTNNNKSNTEFLLDKFRLNFHGLVTRESGLWKPDPGAFLTLMKRFSVAPAETISIGDSLFDIQASKSADITDIFVKINRNRPIVTQTDVGYFTDYVELKRTIQVRYFSEP